MNLPRKILSIFFFSILLFQYHVLKVEGQSSDSSFSIKFFSKANIAAGIGLGHFKTDIVNNYQVRIKNDELLYSFQSINGILISERTGLGIGVGAEPWKDGLFFPVFLNLFYDLEPKENTFYGAISAGYSFGKRYSTVFYESGTGGFMFNLGIGYKMKISKRLRFEYEVFYNYQSVKSKYYIHSDSVSMPSEYNVPYHFLGFRLGLDFH
jgi:hypothetical protein